jgi:hypothetical protein
VLVEAPLVRGPHQREGFAHAGTTALALVPVGSRRVVAALLSALTSADQRDDV